MITGTTFKRIKRRFKKKLYHFLLALNDFNFGRLRPLCYLILIAGVLLAWAKLPTTETTNADSAQTRSGAALADSVRLTVTGQTSLPIDVVALFLPPVSTEEFSSSLDNEPLYSFYLTGKELAYLAEGAITTVSKDNSLYLDGLNFTYHKNRLPFNRVTELTTASGEEVISNQLYHIISTEDIFALFHYISYRSIGIMNVYPKDATGSLLSDYQEVVLTKTGTPFTMQTVLSLAEASASAVAVVSNAPSVITMQSGFNLLDLIKEPSRITVCVCALFISFFALLWYIVPRMNRIRIWFRIYRIRSRKRSTHHVFYGLKRRL